MVFVKVRETYDLHTLPSKMSVIGIHTPRAKIVRRNYPGLLMQCKAWRPVSCDVRMACASMLPLDPLGIGTAEGDVAPEDVFNPILYKAVSNFSMDQIEKLINSLSTTLGYTAKGDSIDATNDGLTADDFGIYYGLLSDTHGWKHANPQSGLNMSSLRPLVYERVYTTGEQGVSSANDGYADGTPSMSANQTQPDTGAAILPNGNRQTIYEQYFKGKAKPMPWLPTLTSTPSGNYNLETVQPGFGSPVPVNAFTATPSPRIFCGVIIVPPSRRHQLFYRLVCEWTLEFSGIRPLTEITTFNGIATIGNAQHIMDYDFGDSKVLSEETELIDTSVDSGIHKVM